MVPPEWHEREARFVRDLRDSWNTDKDHALAGQGGIPAAQRESQEEHGVRCGTRLLSRRYPVGCGWKPPADGLHRAARECSTHKPPSTMNKPACTSACQTRPSSKQTEQRRTRRDIVGSWSIIAATPFETLCTQDEGGTWG